MSDIIKMGGEPTMSSLEIADVVNSNHADVRRSIERLAERGVITLPPMAEVSNTKPGPKTISVYSVGKRDSYVIVAQLSPEFTAKLVDRWQELEKAVPALNPANLSRLQLIEMAMQAEQERLVLENKVAELAPKVEVHDRIADAAGAISLRETATTIGYPERKMILWMQQKDWIYRRAGHKNLLAYAAMIKCGYLVHKVTPVIDANTGQEKISEQVLVTPLGLTVLARRLALGDALVPAGVVRSPPPDSPGARR